MGEIAVIGASGFIGFPLFTLLRKENNVTGTFTVHAKHGLACLDISKKNDVDAFFAANDPDTVILLAGETDVDLCERDKGHAHMVNAIGAKNVAQACEGRRLIYFSTDFVFDGTKGNYSENDRANPINCYGATKLAGENYVRGVEDHLVLRISTPYSFERSSKKFMNIAFEKLKNGEHVRAFGDITRSPTYVKSLNENVALLLKKDIRGILHVSGPEQMSMFEVAAEIAGIFGFDKGLVEKTEVGNAKFDAKRPLDTGLDVSLAKKIGLGMVGLREGLMESRKILERQ